MPRRIAPVPFVVAGILALSCGGTAVAFRPAALTPRPAATPGTITIEIQQSSVGIVVPNGFVSVPVGRSQMFDFIPDDCFPVADVRWPTAGSSCAASQS